VLHYGVPYEPIQGQGHGGPKVEEMANFKDSLLFHLWQMNFAFH